MSLVNENNTLKTGNQNNQAPHPQNSFKQFYLKAQKCNKFQTCFIIYLNSFKSLF